jgi:DNA-binding MarR family transcriptional regulator
VKLETAIKTERFESEQHKAILNIMYTAYWFKTKVSSALKEHSLTGEQYNVLRILKGKHPEQMCVKDIGSRMIEKSSNVPRIIDRLVEKKLVKRVTSKDDKRETIISLTEKGLTVLAAATKAVQQINTELTDMNDENAKKLNGLLELIRTTNE